MTRRDQPARMAGLRQGHLMRVARRVTIRDLIDGAAFVHLALAMFVVVLRFGGV